MISPHVELVILEIVELSQGRWDTRNLDFEYYSRSNELIQPNILYVLRDLERRGLVEAVAIEGGTGPGWRLTRSGHHLLGIGCEQESSEDVGKD